MKQNRNLKIHSVGYNFIMNAVLKLSAFLFPLITFPYVSRVLGPEGNGKIAFAVSVVYYFTVVASLGIPTYGIRACAQYRNDKKALSRTVQELLIISSVLTVVSYLALFAAVLLIPRLRENWVLIAVCSSSLVLTTMGVEWFYQAIEQYDYITVRNLSFKLLSVVMMFLWVRRAEDFILYAGIQVLGTVGSNVLNLIRLREYITLRPVGNYHLGPHLKAAASFFLLTVAATVYTNLDTVMLGFISGDTEVGFYTAAVKMKNILVSAVTALGAVLLPRASFYIQQGKKAEFRQITDKAFRFTFLAALPLSAYCILQATEIITLLSDTEYLGAVPAMIAITPTILLIGLSQITGIQILVPLGLEKYTILSTAAGAVTDLVLNALLIPTYGALGAAIGTLVAEAVVLGVQVFFLRKSEYLRQDSRDLLKILVSTAVATGALALFAYAVPIGSVLMRLCCTAALFFGIYGSLLLVLKESLVSQYVHKFLKRLQHT